MAIELASAYVAIVPSMRGAAREISSQLSGMDVSVAGAKIGDSLTSGISANLKSAGSKFQAIGGQIAGVGQSLTNKITKPVAGATLAVGGLVGALGFKRLVGIDTARAQFQGLGLDADKVMKQVDKGVTNTSLSMAQGASLAVGILATGAVPLRELESSIKRVANVSAAYNVDSEQAAYLLNNVLTKQKVTWGDLSQMQRNQIPIVTQLAEHYDVAADAIMGMAQRGEISVNDLNEVLDKNAGAAAEEYAKSWRGITANITANLGRIGASILENVFPDIKDRASGFLDFLKSDDAKALAADIGVRLTGAFNSLIGTVETLANIWKSLSPGVKKFAVALAGIAVVTGPVLMAVGKIVSGIGGLMLMLAPGSTFMVGLKAVGTGLGALFGPIGLVVLAIGALTAGLVWFFTKTETGQKLWAKAWKGIKSAAASVVDWFNTHVMPVVESVTELLAAVWDGVKAKWERLWADIQTIWGVIGEPVLAAMGATWENLKLAFTLVWDVMKAVVETALGVISGVIDTFTAMIRGDWEGVWNGIKSIFGAVWNGIKSIVSAQLNFVIGLIKNGWNLVKGLFGGLGKSVRSTVSSMWSAVKRQFSSGVNAAVSFVRGLPAKIKSALSGAKTMLVNVGKDIMRGLRNGIDSGFDWIKSKLKGVGRAIPGWLKKVLGISSPSRVMANEIGRWILPGVADGMEATERDFRREVEAALNVSDIRPQVPSLDVGSSPVQLAGVLGGTDKRVALTITNWEEGRGFFELVADGQIRDDRELVLQHGRQF